MGSITVSEHFKTSTAPMFRLLNVEVKPLTIQVAEEFRSMPPSPTERIINEPRITHLTEKAKAELLVVFHWATAQLNKTTYRINGQHSSSMLCNLASFPPGLQVCIEHYEVSDIEGLALLFRQFDDRKSSRQIADISGAYQGLYEAIRNVPRDNAKRAMDGIAWYHKYVRKLPFPEGDDRYVMFSVEKYYPFLLWVTEVLTPKANELKKESIVAAMFATFEKNRVEAERFWYDVKRGGIDSEVTTPPILFDSWLLQEQANTKKTKVELRVPEFYQGAIYAWNAYREGRMISAIKYDLRKGFLDLVE